MNNEKAKLIINERYLKNKHERQLRLNNLCEKYRPGVIPKIDIDETETGDMWKAIVVALEESANMIKYAKEMIEIWTEEL